jgi:transcriptional regulator with XRE-family HTH domain
MTTNLPTVAPHLKAPRSRAIDIDVYVGHKIRECRIMRGMTQQDLANLLGITYQQAHKYEKGSNRVAAGRLYVIAQALDVEPSYFFEGLNPATSSPSAPTDRQRAMLELARNFVHMPNRRHQTAICELARALAGSASGDGEPEASVSSQAV